MKRLIVLFVIVAAAVVGAVSQASAALGIVEVGVPAEHTGVVDNKDDYLMWKNIDIRMLTNFTCQFCGRSVNSAGNTMGCFPRWISETELEIQFQYADDNYLKCSAIRFFQKGDDVYAQRNWTDYYSAATAGSRDFYTNHGNSHITNNDGYAAAQIMCCFLGETRPSPFDVAEVSIGDEIALSGVEAETQDNVVQPTSAVDMWRVHTTDVESVEPPCPMWRNTPLSAVTNIVGYMSGLNLDKQQWSNAWFPHWLSDTEVVVQFQSAHDGAYVKCCLVKFYQFGDDIFAVRYGKRYITSTAEAGTIDFLTASGVSVDADNGGYPVGKIKADILHFELHQDDVEETVTLPAVPDEEAPIGWAGMGQYASDWQVTLNVDKGSSALKGESADFKVVEFANGINVGNIVFGKSFGADYFYFTDSDGKRYRSAAAVGVDALITGVGYHHSKSGLCVIVR